MGLFNWANMRDMKEGKGVEKKKEPALTVFFGIIQRKIWRLITLNLAYFITGLPTWLFMAAMGFGLYYFHSGRADYNVFLPWMLVLIPFIALISGPATMGATFVLRNFSREEHAWVLGDMFEKASKNYVQGLFIGLINACLAFALTYLYFYYGTLQKGLSFVNYIIILLGFILASLRSYIYPMAVTYKLSLANLYRYSLALVIMKFPQNLLLQGFSLAGICSAFYYPNMGIVISAIGGISLLGLVNVFYTDRVLRENMDSAHEKVYPKKERKE